MSSTHHPAENLTFVLDTDDAWWDFVDYLHMSPHPAIVVDQTGQPWVFRTDIYGDAYGRRPSERDIQFLRAYGLPSIFAGAHIAYLRYAE